MNNRALSKAEAAALLGVCEKTVDRLITDGKIRAHKVGNRWKIFEKDLEAYLGACVNA
jgi:excisionase family DNA binding protein